MNKIDIQYWIQSIRGRRGTQAAPQVDQQAAQQEQQQPVMDLSPRTLFSQKDYSVPNGDVKVSVYRSGGETITDE